MVVQKWTHCLSFEIEFRWEAVKLTREKGLPKQAALWAAYHNGDHRVQHWVSLLTMANSSSSSSSSEDASKIATLARQVAELLRSNREQVTLSEEEHKSARRPLVTPQLSLRNTIKQHTEEEGK